MPRGHTITWYGSVDIGPERTLGVATAKAQFESRMSPKETHVEVGEALSTSFAPDKHVVTGYSYE